MGFAKKPLCDNMNIEYDFYFLVLYVVREGDAMKRRLPVVALIWNVEEITIVN